MATGTGGTVAMVVVRAHIQAGGENLGGEEHLHGMVPVAGLADPIGMGVRGCDGRTTAPSLPALHSERSLRLLQSDTFHVGHIPTCAGTGPIPTVKPGIGTIADDRGNIHLAS
jgi:hypothetical protein